MNKTKHITFRCTEEQFKEFKAAAKKLDISLSAFILRSVQMTEKQVNKNYFPKLSTKP